MKPLINPLKSLCMVLLALLPWSCDDHRIPPASALLIGCKTGWSTVDQTYHGLSIGGLAPDCYRIVFGQDGQLTVDRSRCVGQTTSPLVLGSWSSTDTQLRLPSRPWNSFGTSTNSIAELTATTLRFGWRGGPDRIEEIWTCNE
ncbi:hypothetical protein [Spirosoma panaciterrae]|uniref:hypothetical protein n=1 Tax=Spirosoma panaciterrae TaxID=496058 RepID=UPI000374F1EB|nr:hypothetical protein [Spirosoma panaciterrae]